MNDFDTGVNDAKIDLDENWLKHGETLDSIISHLRVSIDASDEYIAGYLSEVYKPCFE